MSWKDKLRRLPAPEPPDELLPRILASRAAGVRVVLPEATAATVRARYVRYAAAMAALVAGGWLAFSTLRPSTFRHAAGPPIWSLDGTPLFPAIVLGQERREYDVRARYALITTTVPSSMRPGRWTYEIRWITDGVFTSSQGQRTITRVASKRDGKPVWLMTESGHDTVLIDQASLRPLRYVRPMRRQLLIQEFGRDSMVELFHGGTPPNERHFQGSAALPGLAGSPLLVAWSPYSIDALFQALPLARGWQGSVYSVNWLAFSDRVPAFTPVDLRVTGTGRITVPAGTFDCWKLGVRDGFEKTLVWVSKDQRWLVMRQRAWSDDSGEWRIEAVLTAVDTTPPAP